MQFTSVTSNGGDLVGRAIAHDSAERHVTGDAVYVDDLPQPEGLLHVAPGYAPLASGRITHLDLDAVKAARGVIAVLTGTSVPGANDVSPQGNGDDPLIASDRVNFFGQVAFAVVAETREQARRAARLGKIATAPAMPIIDIEDALVAQTAVLPDYMLERGEVLAEIERAPRQITGEMRIGGQEHFYLESQVALALPGENGDIAIHASTQHPGEVQRVVARVLGRPQSSVTVEVRRVGGGFGGKQSQASQWAALAALAAHVTGLPCKLRLDRADDMIMTGKRHDFRVDYAAGFDKAGVVRAADITLNARCGHSEDLSRTIVDRAMLHIDNSYFYPNVRVLSRRLRTNTVSNTAFRGIGGPEGALFAERLMDHIAHVLGRDPLDVRKVNLYGGAGRDRTPYNMRLEDNLLPELIAELERTSEYWARRKTIADFNISSPVLKRGIALTPVKFGVAFTQSEFNQANALVQLYRDGSIGLDHGGVEMGQGLLIKVAQVVAEIFGVELDRVKLSATNTAKVANAPPTAASIGTELNAEAALAACQTIKDRLHAFIEEKWNVPRERIEFRDGQVTIGNRTIDLGEITDQAWRAGVPLSAAGFYKMPALEWNREKASGRPFHYFVYGTACSEVTIDTMTGEMRVDRVDILQEVGKSLNPAIDLGQIEGGFVQGMGWLTSEELVWNSTGQLMTHSPSTYKVPTASDLPADFRVALFESQRNREGTVERAKAVGEASLMLAISVFSAITDAIASLKPGAMPRLDAPATPEAIMRAVRTARGGNG